MRPRRPLPSDTLYSYWLLAIEYWLLYIGLRQFLGGKSSVQAFGKLSSMVVCAAFVATVVTGCETGRYNKRHSPLVHIGDVSTTGHPDESTPANAEGQPPVPGSPTAAGPNGKQPWNDNEARESPGVDAMASAPNQSLPDAFQRQ